MRILHSLSVLTILFLVTLCSACARKPIQGVIITGQNNHNWPVSHKAIKMILENSRLFKVDIAVSPAAGEDMSSFDVDFSKYAFVFLDYNGDPWPEKMNTAFFAMLLKARGILSGSLIT